MHLLFIDEDNKRKPLRNEANSPFKTSSGNKITAHFGYIGTIQTLVKVQVSYEGRWFLKTISKYVRGLIS
jgi:hypothetical protein